jgi:peptidyl-prolyl cis-trans isomerase D
VFVLGVGGGHRSVKIPERLVFGVNVNSEQEMQRFGLLTSISADLQFGENGLQGNQFQNYLFQRLALLGLAEKHSIPGPNQTQAADFVRRLARFRDDAGNFDPAKYAQYNDQLKANPRITEVDVAQVLEEDFRIEKAGDLLSGPGYLLDWEADRMLASMQTTFDIQTAELSYTDFTPTIEATDDAVKAFYEQAGSRYEEPEKREVRAVRFDAASFAGSVTAPTEEQLRAYFTANLAKFTPPAPPAVDAVEAALRTDAASKLAGRAADDFTYALFESGAKPGSPELEAFLAARNVTATLTPAFTANSAPAGFNWPSQITSQAFILSTDRPVSDPLPLGSDFQVLIYASTIPARLPALEEVKERVVRDYREQERRRLFTEKGTALRTELTAKLTAGSTLETASKELGLAFQKFTDVNRQQPAQGLDWAVFSQIDDLETGAVSNMITTAAKGVFAVVSARKEPAAESMGFMASFVRQNLMQRTAQQTRMLAVNELLKAEFDRTAPPEEREAEAAKVN